MLLRLVGLMNLILILSCPVSVQEREPYLWDLVKNNGGKKEKKRKRMKKSFIFTLVQTFTYRLISFRLGVMI